MAVFPPMLGADDYPARAVACARALMRAPATASREALGSHWRRRATGTVWFGAVGEGAHVEITVVGDTINVTARLAAAAEPGSPRLRRSG